LGTGSEGKSLTEDAFEAKRVRVATVRSTTRGGENRPDVDPGGTVGAAGLGHIPDTGPDLACLAGNVETGHARGRGRGITGGASKMLISAR
jgi:hypothetical protein